MHDGNEQWTMTIDNWKERILGCVFSYFPFSIFLFSIKKICVRQIFFVSLHSILFGWNNAE